MGGWIGLTSRIHFPPRQYSDEQSRWLLVVPATMVAKERHGRLSGADTTNGREASRRPHPRCPISHRAERLGAPCAWPTLMARHACWMAEEELLAARKVVGDGEEDAVE